METTPMDQDEHYLSSIMELVMIDTEKSIEKRTEEYTDIYNYHGYDEEDIDFRKMWSSYLASTIESAGWLALWKLSKSSCFEYHMQFATSFVVTVIQVDYETLSAEVELIDNDESKRFHHLPRKLSVPLIDVYISKEQESSVLFTDATAECLGQLRIFYKYLWWPWDTDECLPSNWMFKNLKHRLKLYDDITQGNYSEDIVKEVKSLLEKGKFFYSAYLKETEGTVNDEDVDNVTKKKIVEYMRNIELIKRWLKDFTDSKWIKFSNYALRENKTNSEAFLVVPKFTLKSMIACTQEIAKSHPFLELKQVEKKLESVLNKCKCYDVIFLSPEEHILYFECLNTNVTIRNSLEEKSSICGKSQFWYLLKTTADNVSLQNLIIRAEESLVLIYVKGGITYLDSITMINSTTKKQKAIIVEKNATLVANKCHFLHLDTAITCLPGSAVQLTDCTFQSNHLGIEIFDDVQLCLNNVVSSQSEETFIKYKGDIPSSNELKSFDELSRIGTISLSLNNVEVDNKKYIAQFG